VIVSLEREGSFAVVHTHIFHDYSLLVST